MMTIERTKALSLFEDHGDAVYRTAYGILGSAADAQDATQEVFLYLLRKPDALAGVDAPRSWLHRSAVNAALKTLRGGKARVRREEVVSRRRSVVQVAEPDSRSAPR